MRIILSTTILFAGFAQPVGAADPPKRNWEVVELTGTASEYWFSRNWRSYYWREDFTFLLSEDGTNRRGASAARPTASVCQRSISTTTATSTCCW
jgi:hypothetical protein